MWKNRCWDWHSLRILPWVLISDDFVRCSLSPSCSYDLSRFALCWIRVCCQNLMSSLAMLRAPSVSCPSLVAPAHVMVVLMKIQSYHNNFALFFLSFNLDLSIFCAHALLFVLYRISKSSCHILFNAYRIAKHCCNCDQIAFRLS